ncbi:Nitrogenase iron protein 1 [anaerobic digester metagenome]
MYGKGGIGKSTTVSNISAVLAEAGYTVMQVGCDPKADSTRNLTDGKPIRTVLDIIRENENAELDDVIFKGYAGVYCFETGGPTPGVGCAGRGVITALEKIEELKIFSVLDIDIVIYDVLGDVVCGGFAMPIRNGYAEEVYVVTSGEMMSLYAANNISTAVKQFKSRGYAELKGLILNARNLDNEVETVKIAAKEMGTDIIHYIPRDKKVQKSEKKGMTVVQAFPNSKMTENYRNLSEKIIKT